MTGTFKAEEIEIGYNPEGFRIDKTASPLNRYTRWEIRPDGKWLNPKPVCFHELPASGWVRAVGFVWEPEQ